MHRLARVPPHPLSSSFALHPVHGAALKRDSTAAAPDHLVMRRLASCHCSWRTLSGCKQLVDCSHEQVARRCIRKGVRRIALSAISGHWRRINSPPPSVGPRLDSGHPTSPPARRIHRILVTVTLRLYSLVRGLFIYKGYLLSSSAYRWPTIWRRRPLSRNSILVLSGANEITLLYIQYPVPVTGPGWAYLMAAAAQCAAPTPQHHQRRRPELTLWNRTVQTHLETWLELATGEDGESPPAHVERTFRRDRECGILAYGFARAYCDE